MCSCEPFVQILCHFMPICHYHLCFVFQWFNFVLNILSYCITVCTPLHILLLSNKKLIANDSYIYIYAQLHQCIARKYCHLVYTDEIISCLYGQESD